MIIELSPHATDDQTVALEQRLADPRRRLARVEYEGRRFVTVSGLRDDIDRSRLAQERWIASVSDADLKTFFVRSSFRPGGTVIPLGRTELRAGGDLVVIAGPCTVEDEAGLLATAKAVRSAGAHALRAGAFKPRTSPYNFQGVGSSGLRLLAEVGAKVQLPVVSEILDPRDVQLGAELLDVIQVGTRNMTNQALLGTLGTIRKPVLLKRGSSARLEELLGAAEFIASGGNLNIALCERGIQSFDTVTRNTLDLSAVPALRQMTHLPIVVDPSHATGRKDLVRPMALAAAVAGADALLIEVHVDPASMVRPGDAAQALLPHELEDLLRQLEIVLTAVGRKLARS
jgi:3-deoxy-7-phosphoheptulonate synthase